MHESRSKIAKRVDRYALTNEVRFNFNKYLLKSIPNLEKSIPNLIKVVGSKLENMYF